MHYNFRHPESQRRESVYTSEHKMFSKQNLLNFLGCPGDAIRMQVCDSVHFMK